MHTPSSPLEASQAQTIAEQSVQALFAGDCASQFLGMKIEAVMPGEASVSMRVRDDMLNGHQTCHGGLLFSLADSAFAFACNSYGDNVVAAQCSIDYLAPAHGGDVLTAVAKQIWQGGRSGLYAVSVSNQKGELLALFRGRSHRIAGRVVESVVVSQP
jgi:acyl-CoA thioesterase